MIELECTQNDQVWHSHRAGIPTASAAKHLMTPGGKKATGEGPDKYMYLLLAERCMAIPRVSFTSFWMQRGHDEEETAVELYEFTRKVKTRPVGFILNEAKDAGASPDRAIEEASGGLEIKNPKPEVHFMYLLKDGSAWKEYKPQLQFQLMITGWEFMDLYSYYDGLPPALIRTERDEQYITDLRGVVAEFNVKLEAKFTELIDQGLAFPDWRNRNAITQGRIVA